MKTNKLFLGLATIAATVFSFTSCSQDELTTAKAETPDLGQEILLSTNFSTTRTVSQDIQTVTQIVNGVQVGVFVATNGSATSFVENGTNKAYTADGNGGLTAVNTESKVYYPKTGSVDIYAYAPYQSTWNVTDVNANQDFTVQADQSSEANYLASDLIWATPKTGQASTTDALALPFAHKLSKININIVNNRSGLSLKGATVSILNTVRTATISPSTGAVAAKDGVTASAVTAAAYGTESEPTATTASPTTASAIIVPQTIAANTKFIQVVTNAAQNNNESITLTAKIGTSAKTFAANKRYKYTLTINDNSVELTFNGTSLGTWEDEEESGNLEEEVTYGFGDYVLNDGTFLKNSALSEADETTKGKIIAVIFSTNSSDTGYDGYAVSVEGKLSTNDLEWSTSAGSVGTLKANLSDAIADYSGLSTKTTASTNYGTYPAFQCTGAPDKTGTNLSDWFIPSVGQMVDIIQNLGEQSDIRSTITTEGASQSGNNNISIPTSISTFLPKINAYAVAVKGEGKVIITASGDGSSDSNCFQYVTSTEKDESNLWMIKFPAADAANQRIYLSRGAAKTGTSNRNVLPIIAYKVPTE